MKTKVEVRAKALELAITIAVAQIKAGIDGVNVEAATRSYEAYILGDVDLPEREESIESHIGDVIAQVKKLYDAAGLGECNATPIDVGEIEKMVIANNRKYEKD